MSKIIDLTGKSTDGYSLIWYVSASDGDTLEERKNFCKNICMTKTGCAGFEVKEFDNFPCYSYKRDETIPEPEPSPEPEEEDKKQPEPTPEPEPEPDKKKPEPAPKPDKKEEDKKQPEPTPTPEPDKKKKESKTDGFKIFLYVLLAIFILVALFSIGGLIYKSRTEKKESTSEIKVNNT
jgi:hypothetical protein